MTSFSIFVGLLFGAIPTALASDPLWFTQTLDHFGDTKESTTFQQRYWHWSFAEEGTEPEFVFLKMGGEEPEYGHENAPWADYAKQFQADCFVLEHRFYGESVPAGEYVDYPSNIEYLSSDQALADMAQFIQAQNLPDAKWVTFGGSYAGTLAAWARQTYPQLVHAAISSSAPLLAEVLIPGFDTLPCRGTSKRTLGLTPFLHRSDSRTRSYANWDQNKDQAWNHQCCHEFGWLETVEGQESEEEAISRACAGDEQTIHNGIKRTNEKHHGIDFSTERVLFIHGSCDAWHLAGKAYDGNPRVPVFMIEGGGHCYDMIAPGHLADLGTTPEVLQNIEEAHNITREYLSTWLAEPKDVMH